MFVVSFHGGFANQLFQYAFYLKLIEDFPAVKIFADISHYKRCKDHGGFKLRRLVNLQYFNGNKEKQNFENINEINYSETKIDVNKNYWFDGYWQDIAYFPKDMTLISNIFTKSSLSKKNIELAKSIEHCNSVSIHVRRGDYVSNYMHGNIANEMYFKNAIEYIHNKIDKPTFFVFSDDLDWCRTNLKFYDDSVYFVEGNQNEVWQDITLMSLCRHNIISNSSFSWWAQYLNTNVNKTVITPEYWFNQSTPTVTDLIVESAVKIPNVPTDVLSVSEPFFTVIVPVYNTAKTLRRTLASVLNQSFADIQVVVVNDASTDNSEEILESYAIRDKRIKLVNHNQNQSSLVARITGVNNAIGKYVLFLDSDDWLELNALECLHKSLINKPVDVLEFGYIREPLKYREPIVKNCGNRLENLLLSKYAVTLWNKTYERQVLLSAFSSFEPFYTTFAEDAFFSVVISFFAESFDYCAEYLHHYSVATGISTQNNYTLEKFDKIISDTIAVRDNLNIFIRKNAPQYQKYVSDFMFQRYSFLRYLALQGSDKVLCSKLLLKLDDSLGTSFFDEYINELSRYESFAKLCMKDKCKFAIKYVVKKVLIKLKNERLLTSLGENVIV